MKIENLSPLPNIRTQFAWSHHITVPEQPGCYALVTYSGDVLYVGLATKSVRSRMGNHLDTREKRKPTSYDAPFWFYYILLPDSKVESFERGWMNQSILEDGEIPPLNKIYSPS